MREVPDGCKRSMKHAATDSLAAHLRTSTDVRPGCTVWNRTHALRTFKKSLVMCLAIPMQIKTMEGFTAVCEAQGVEREVSLFMLQGQPLDAGDHVLVHVGYAIQKITPEEARSTWELLNEIADHA